ncbi:MAG TPA: PAS domain S-box protein [Polyangia bacterium]|nr:PAS domain S-box protein [Polyangia bacterium]
MPGLRRLLRRAVLLPLATLGILAGVLLWQVSELIATNEWVDHTDQVIRQIHLVEKRLLEMRAGVHGFIFTGDASAREAFEIARRQLDIEIVRLSGLVSDNRTQVTAVAELTGAIADWRVEAQRIAAMTPGSPSSALVPLVRDSRDHLETLRARLGPLVEREQDLRRQRAEASQRRAAWVYRSGVLLLVLGGGILALMGRRQLMALSQLFDQQSLSLRQQAESLARSERNLGTTLDSIGDAVIVTDARARVTRLNPVAEALTGWSNREAQGKGLDEVFRIINEETGQVVESPSVRVLREGIVVGLANHTALIARGGAQFPIADSGAPIRDDSGALTGLVLVFRDMTADRQKEEAVRASARRFRALVQYSADVVMVQNADRAINYVSASAEGILGHRSADLLGQPLQAVAHPDDRATLESLFGRLMEAPGQAVAAQFRIRHQDGSWRWMEGHAVNLIDDRDVKGIVTNIRDVTERRGLEEQLMQVQKTEAIGRLAGGIAHDFNNLLTVVIGNCHVVLQDPASASIRQDIEEIRDAGERAAALTRQLLAFGRRQVLMPELRPLNALVTDVEKLLRRVLGEQVELGVRLGGETGTIKVDPGQFEQVLLNLAINARDAMPHGGRLTIETQAVELDEEYARQHPGVVPGQYAMMAVSDTGAGMDLEVQSHIFEPFFTTKPKGKGSGLGLATVYGIVRQTRGHIWFYSAVDHGTVFKVYFPRAHAVTAALPPAVPGPARPSGGRETILVIEDDVSLRRFTSRILRDLGYTVVEAARGEEALTFLHTNPQHVDLVLTDVIMPGVTGRALEARLLAAAPHLKIVFTSGYTDDAIVHHGVLDEGTHFIQKPFTPAALGQKIRAVLDGEAPRHISGRHVIDVA